MRLLIVLLVGLSTVAGAQTVDLAGQQLARYHALNAELRCLICQNRSIAESDAPLAADLRAIVARQIAAGESDREIKQYLVDRYGEWVLYDPPLDRGTLILWFGPFVLLALGLVIVAVIMRRRRAEPAPSLDRERLARVLEQHEAAGPDTDRSRDNS